MPTQLLPTFIIPAPSTLSLARLGMPIPIYLCSTVAMLLILQVTYRNLAKLAGVAYLCVRAEGLLMRDWTELPVKVDREAFVRALDAAVCLARESTARQ